ncbi:MAG: ABC transporter ATP-binding protein [Candidatus Omnitrophica bacterium]|nr:ABC transporter ATP-binding protein [Candidatus Omnitrophota bacterium]
MGVYGRLLAYLKPYRGRLVLAGLCTLLYTVAHSLVSVTVFIVLNGLQNKDYVNLKGLPHIDEWLGKLHLPAINISDIQFPTYLVPFIVVAVFLFRGAFEYLSRYQMSAVGLRAVRKVREDLYAHIVKLPMSFYSKGRTGELMSRTMNDVGVIQAGVTDVFVDLVKQPLVILFQIPLVFLWGGPLAFTALLLFPIVLGPVILLGRQLRKIERKTQEQLANINAEMQETFSGSGVVKAFNMQTYEIRRFEGIHKNVFNFLKRSLRIMILQRPLIDVIGSVGVALAVWYGMRVLPLDRFASFVTTLFLFYEPLKKMSKANASLQQAVAAGTRVFELMDIAPEILSRAGAIKLEKAIHAIEYRNLTFAYESSKEVLQNINLTVHAGEVTALVGTSGAGKTTFVNLLLRFYDPTQGVILINGRDIRDYELNSLRNQVGVVTQETFLFNATVLENIAYGRLEASFEEVKKAAEVAFADEFIKVLPQGYATVIGERGVTLSGGQRQRLSIARALLKNPPILILDEATSQLDTESERQVQKALEKLMEGRTVFAIAHRLSTIQNADRIIVLDRGKLVQMGTNETLLKEGGVYKRLYDLQFNV